MRRFVLADIVAGELRRTDEQAAPAHTVQHPRALVFRLQLRGCLTRLGGVLGIGAFSELPIDVVAAVGIVAMHPPKHEAKELRAGEALLDGFLIGFGAEHVAASDEAWVDRGTDRLATGAHELPVACHPLHGVLWRLKADAQRPNAEPGGE